MRCGGIGSVVLFRREWAALARHAELLFDLLIVWPQIVVTDWPIRTHAFGGERAEIVAMESRHYAQPGQSAAAHARSGFRNHKVRADKVARLGPHDFARICLRVLQGRWPAEPRPGFKYAYRQPVRRHPQRHERPGRPCSDDEHIKRAREVGREWVTDHSDTIPKRRISVQDQNQRGGSPRAAQIKQVLEESVTELPQQPDRLVAEAAFDGDRGVSREGAAAQRSLTEGDEAAAEDGGSPAR